MKNGEPRRVSIVIPCFNPVEWLIAAIESVRAQTHKSIEILVVDDGSTSAESKAVLRKAHLLADRFIEQPNRGPAAARNAGFRIAEGDYFVPLDADDLLEPRFVEECLSALEAQPAAGFAYTDTLVFGDRQYVERVPAFNLYRQLSRNALAYACMTHRPAWEAAGGYNESLRFGYEDWEFYLRLGARGYSGCQVNRVLLRYRKHGRSLTDIAQERHAELMATIHADHPELYSPAGKAAIKAIWEPAVCISSSAEPCRQTIVDYEVAATTDVAELQRKSRANAFLIARGEPLDAMAAERAALAIWSGADGVQLPGGSIAVSRSSLSKWSGTANTRESETWRPGSGAFPGFFESVQRHLANANLLSLETWKRHPGRSLARLIPLRFKERVNAIALRQVFDLSFYLQFQPEAVMLAGAPVKPLEYLPAPATRMRIAFVTPHLGVGGAEAVFLDVAEACGRDRHEISVIATQSRDDRWMGKWSDRADHVYDLARLVPPERMAAAVYSIAANWRFDAVMIQNSLHAYSILAALKKSFPATRIIDMVHAVNEQGWDLISVTETATPYIDMRVAISEAVRDRLLRSGTPPERIRLIRNGVDVARFVPGPSGTENPPAILFAGRLDPVKRPLLLVDIARALRALRGSGGFRMVVAGTGPQKEKLQSRIRRAGLDNVFQFLDHTDEMPKVFARCDIVVITSANEGIPLVALEAMASARPVVASATGAVGEAVHTDAGVLIPPGPREAERFAEAIDGLLRSVEARDRMGRQGRERVEKEYDRSRAVMAYADLFS